MEICEICKTPMDAGLPNDSCLEVVKSERTELDEAVYDISVGFIHRECWERVIK